MRITSLLSPRFTHLLIRSFVLLVFSLIITGCRKGVQEQKIVYSNDFENSTLSGISGGKITSYNQSKVLGRYNKDGFELLLDDLPAHNIIEVSFDLNIHDTWDGNNAEPDGPDIWKLTMEGATFINTTFSNKVCPYTCFPQSYPFNYLNSNQQPKNGAYLSNLPGVCLQVGEAGGTSMYKIIKRMAHKSKTFSMKCIDQLSQPNTGDQLCDESWSVDNLVIKTIKLD